jgi:hypothetical protein
MALRWAIRRCSLLETKKRFFFTSLKTLSLITFFRKRLSKLSGDSPDRSQTLVILDLPPFHHLLLDALVWQKPDMKTSPVRRHHVSLVSAPTGPAQLNP